MLSLLIDENLNHRILRGLLRSVPHVDHTLVAAALKGASDPDVLEFAAKEHRVLVSVANRRRVGESGAWRNCCGSIPLG